MISQNVDPPEEEEEQQPEPGVLAADAVIATTTDDRRSPLKAIPLRVNSPAVRASPGPRDSSGKPVEPGGIRWKTSAHRVCLAAETRS